MFSVCELKLKCVIRSQFLRRIFDLTIVLLVLIQWQHHTAASAVSLKARLLRNTTRIRTRSHPIPQKTAALPSSSPGLTFMGSVGSKSFYTDPEKMGVAWAEALDFCHELGLQPASVENLAEHKLVRNYLANLPHRFFWLAGTDYFHEGTWRWMKSGENFKFSKWTQGYPSKNRKTNCLYLSYGNDGWIDASCSSNKLIIRPLCQTL